MMDHVEILQALEQTGEAFVITDREGIISYASSGIEKLTGYMPDELLSQHTRIFRAEVDPLSIYDEMWETILAKQTWSGIIHNKRKDGSVYLEKMTIKPILDERGEIKWFLARKRNAAIMGNHYANGDSGIEIDTVAKENVLDIVSNLTGELQSSLQMILGFSRILHDDLERLLSGDQAEYFEIITRGTQRLLRMLEDTQLVTRLECNDVQYQPELINAAEELRSLLTHIYPIHNADSVRFIKVIEDAGALIRVDRKSFATIVTHLVINAMKFTKEGSVTIGLQIQSGQAVIWIIDTGVGISEQFKPSVFKSFRQEELGFLREFEGAGLGLAITSKVVEQTGGTITFESYKGSGTTFIVSYPVAGWEGDRPEPIIISANGSGAK